MTKRVKGRKRSDPRLEDFRRGRTTGLARSGLRRQYDGSDSRTLGAEKDSGNMQDPQGVSSEGGTGAGERNSKKGRHTYDDRGGGPDWASATVEGGGSKLVARKCRSSLNPSEGQRADSKNHDKVRKGSERTALGGGR